MINKKHNKEDLPVKTDQGKNSRSRINAERHRHARPSLVA